MQKYPDNVLFGRHGESVFVEIDSNDIPGYRDFSRLFYDEFSALESNLQVKASLFPGRVQLPNHLKPFPSDRLTQMALNALQAMKDDKRFAPLLGNDKKTPLTKKGFEQWVQVGEGLEEYLDGILPERVILPDQIRTVQSYEGLIHGCPKLRGRGNIDNKFREQEMGLRIDDGDPLIYAVLNPRYAWHFKQRGLLEYRHEGGESMEDVIDRGRESLDTLSNRYGGLESGKPSPCILVITHHRFMLAIRFLLESWDQEILEHNDLPPNRPPVANLLHYVGVDGEKKATRPEATPSVVEYAKKGWLELKDEEIPYRQIWKDAA